MNKWTRRGFLGSVSGGAAAATLAAQQRGSMPAPEKRTGHVPIKITDLRCAIIGRNPVVRVVTDQGISGYGEAESAKPYLKPMVLFYKDYVLGEDPTDVAARDAEDPAHGCIQALGIGGKRHRDRALGYRRAGGRSAGL